MRGWSAEVLRYTRLDSPGSYVDVITASLPGPSVLEVLGITAHDSGAENDRRRVDAVQQAAASRGADVPGRDELRAAGLASTGIRVLVDGAAVEFTGLRGTDLWCCRAQVADAAVLIAGIHWPDTITELVRTENPTPAGSLRFGDLSEEERLANAWDEAIRDGSDAISSSGTGGIVVDQPERLIIALHVRDAAQLAVGHAPPIPALFPSVPRLTALDQTARSKAAAQWPSWWRRLADSVDQAPDAPASKVADLADGPELHLLVEQDLGSAQTWARQRKDEFVNARRSAPEWEIVSRATGGNLAHGHTLRVSALPLEGKFGAALSERHLIVSHVLRSDARAYSAWLEQMLPSLG